MKPVLLDTGVIVALLDSTDNLHSLCVEAIAEVRAPLITCEAVIAESCYLLRYVEGGPEAVLHSVVSRDFLIPAGLSELSADVHRILTKHRDRRIDLADAVLIQLAAQFNTGEILTVDRDFRIYRWGRNNPFNILVTLD